MSDEIQTTQRPTLEDPEVHFTERMWTRAQRCIADGRITEARALLESLLRRQPGRFAARMLLASVHLKQGRVRDAAEQARLASGSLPDDAEAVATASDCLLRIGEMVAARDILERFDAKSRDLDGRHLRLLARDYQKLGDNTSALELMELAHAKGYDNGDFRYFRGLQYQFHGQFEAATGEMRECLRLLPTYGRAALALSRLSRRNPDPERVAFIRAQLPAVPQGTEEHAAFEFAQYEELAALKDFAGAFAALERGNEIMFQRLVNEVRISAYVFDGIRRLATPAFVNGPGLSGTDGPIPIFVVGMPRSGTTVLDRMLNNHPDVVSSGERTDFPLQLRWCANLHGNQAIDIELMERIPQLDYAELGSRYLEQTQWRAQGKSFYVDKLPPNHLLVGLIHRALPFAPILLMDREPMGVCFSNYKALFGNSYAYSYRLDELAEHFALYDRLMRHWGEVVPDALMQVDYRQLVTAPEAMLSRVFAHCGLRAVEGCGDLTRNRETPVATLSCVQVRESVHTRGLDEWTRYRTQLEPLRKGLEAAGVRG